MEYASKIALITGGAGGLGKGFTVGLLKRGAKVCMADIDVTGGTEYADTLEKEYPGKVIFTKCDVTSDESFTEAFNTCEQKLGKVNMLVNNAGAGDEINWKQTMDINLGAVIRGTQYALDRMSKDKGFNGGNVINVSSYAGVKTIPFAPIYGTTKVACVQHTRNTGHPFHVAYTGVQVQALCPTFVDTPFLQNSKKPAWTPQCKSGVAKSMATIPVMSVSKVVDAFFKLLEEQKPAAVMAVIPGKEPYYIEDKSEE